MWAIRAGRVHVPAGFLDGGGVVIGDDGRLAQVGRWEDLRVPSGAPVRDLRPHLLAAGFLDLHVHGAGGHDFMDAGDEDFEAACRWHAERGTTSLLATTVTAPLEPVCRVFDRTRAWRTRPNAGARVLGVHVEGPFFNVEMRGAHLPEYIRNPAPQDVALLLEHTDVFRHITIAPEIEGALDAIERFAAAGVSVAVAHSNGTSDDVDAAILRGLRHVTHLYNAMSVYHRQGHRRLSGIVEAALTRDELTVELIADGLHVNPTRLRLAVRAKGASRVCLVSDAMRAAGMPDGLYPVGPRGGKIARVRDGIAVMPEGTGLAGSTATMGRCVQVMVRDVGVPPSDALAMASAHPARVIGVEGRKGAVKEGLDADLVALDDALRARMTVVEGRVVYDASA